MFLRCSLPVSYTICFSPFPFGLLLEVSLQSFILLSYDFLSIFLPFFASFCLALLSCHQTCLRIETDVMSNTVALTTVTTYICKHFINNMKNPAACSFFFFFKHLLKCVFISCSTKKCEVVPLHAPFCNLSHFLGCLLPFIFGFRTAETSPISALVFILQTTDGFLATLWIHKHLQLPGWMMIISGHFQVSRDV